MKKKNILGLIGLFSFWLAMPVLANSNVNFSETTLFGKETFKSHVAEMEMLQQLLAFGTEKSSEFLESPMLLGTSVLKNFVEEKAFNKSALSSEESDMRALEEAQFFLSMDVWDFVSQYQDREEGVKIYLAQLDLYGESIKNTSKYFGGKETANKNGVVGLKKQISQQETVFKNALKNFDESKATDAQMELGELNRKLIILQKEGEKNVALKKTSATLEKKLAEQKKAVEENRDAVVKNVRTKIPSGLTIGAVEE